MLSFLLLLLLLLLLLSLLRIFVILLHELLCIYKRTNIYKNAMIGDFKIQNAI